jgi:hypothetical protein
MMVKEKDTSEKKNKNNIILNTNEFDELKKNLKKQSKEQKKFSLINLMKKIIII